MASCRPAHGRLPRDDAGHPDARPTTQAYDRLLVATDATPVIPQVAGLDLAGVFGLDVMEDAIALTMIVTG